MFMSLSYLKLSYGLFLPSEKQDTKGLHTLVSVSLFSLIIHLANIC